MFTRWRRHATCLCTSVSDFYCRLCQIRANVLNTFLWDCSLAKTELLDWITHDVLIHVVLSIEKRVFLCNFSFCKSLIIHRSRPKVICGFYVVEPEGTQVCMYIFILMWDRKEKKMNEGGRKSKHFLHPLFSSDELIMQPHIFVLFSSCLIQLGNIYCSVDN